MPRIFKSVLAERDPETNGYRILAPEVGTYYRSPELGAFLKTGSLAGLLKRLNSLCHLRVPEDVSGFVTSVAVNDIANSVEYRQELFRLVPGQTADIESAVRQEDRAPFAGEAIDVPEGTLPIFSPTDGIFYRRPNPESPPYVQEGDVIVTGTVLGLVEVMKSFNQIRFGGPKLPPTARITKILVDDADEIRSSQVLFWVSPE